MQKDTVTVCTTTTKGHRYWEARYLDPLTGKRRSKSLGRVDKVSERQAKKLAQRLEVQFEDQPAARSDDKAPMLGDWCEHVIQQKEVVEGRTPATMNDYRLVKRLLVAHFGERRRMDAIAAHELTRFRLRLASGEFVSVMNRRNKRLPGQQTVTKLMRYVKAIFKAAHDAGGINRNPAANLKLDQPAASEWCKVSIADFWKLYDACPADSGARVLFALCRLAALRSGDAMNLRWSNVRFDEGVLVFRPAKVKRYAKRDAQVPMAAALRSILEEVRAESLRLDGYVVPRRGIPREIGDKMLPRLCEAAELTPWAKPLHTLRKSCIDDWARLVGPQTLMEWATHQALATTMRFYTKASEGDLVVGRGDLFDRVTLDGTQLAATS